MPEYMIADISVNFPFEPYDVQKAYMEKVITCLKTGTNGILESPTGTGKTLSLLCSSLAWLLSRKAAVQSQLQKGPSMSSSASPEEAFATINEGGNSNWGVPKIIYASRTHSQLTQAMQELKRTAYSFMRAVVLGSRDQLCIHPEVMREQGNTNKIQMCKVRVESRSCTFYSRVESKKDHPDFRGPSVVDIEDLVVIGQKLKMCPYYASKELVGNADITFMPYNYLLDPKARKANKVDLHNTIVILDEAHNIEKMCEESASVQLKSSDVAMAIEDVTHIMKAYSDKDVGDAGDEPKDFTMDDLALLKEMLLDLERVIDDIVVQNKDEGATFPPTYLFELLEKANFSKSTAGTVVNILEKLLQYLTVQTQNSSLRKGGSFQILGDFLSAVYFHKDESFTKIHKSFKVHVEVEEVKQQNTRGGKNTDVWLSKASSTTTTTKMAKIINYWCFNPGFGMESLLNKNIRSIILTSGTLAPLTPLIAELALPVAERLENPHIVGKSQVYVKIVGYGPDREQLISNYANRDNPKYISSLGQTILNVARIVPDGLLVFFPSYPLMNQCVNTWQASGLWQNICQYKPIYVEPRGKESFTTTMDEFYKSIRDSKGACFMAVCRGKVSEGLDFADRNGRAVIITGLPFPPLKDPKVILKRRYLNDNRTKANELLSGQEWYGLEATRAVNQAIGRVIRHKNDYGAILLCDYRFQQSSQVQQLSKWIREHLGNDVKSSSFGPVVRELKEFFKNAEKTMPKPQERFIESIMDVPNNETIVKSEFFSNPKEILDTKSGNQFIQARKTKAENTNSVLGWTPDDYASAAGRSRGEKEPTAIDFISRLDTDVSVIDFNESSSSTSSNGLVSIRKRERTSPNAKLFALPSNSTDVIRKKRFKLVGAASFSSSPSNMTQQNWDTPTETSQIAEKKQAPEDRVEFLRELRSVLNPEEFSEFTEALISYKKYDTIEALIQVLLKLLGQQPFVYLLLGMRRFLKPEHKILFNEKVAHVL